MSRKKNGLSLPKGWDYSMVAARRGKLNKGDGPFVLFTKGDVHLKLDLTVLDFSGSCNFPAELEYEIEDLRTWAELKQADLFAEAELHHFIQFETGSTCYYDYTSEQLFGAYGTKNGKGINGEPTRFTRKQLILLMALTSSRGRSVSRDALYSAAEFSDEGDMASTLSTHISSLKKYDSSLHNTIDFTNTGYKYSGNPDYWFVGEHIPGHTEDGGCITLEKIFSIFSHLQLIVSNPPAETGLKFQASRTDSASVAEKLLFLLPPAFGFIGLAENPEASELLFSQNQFDGGEAALLALYGQGQSYKALDRLWNYLKLWLTDNYEASYSSSLYFGVDNVIPSSAVDLEPVSEKIFFRAKKSIYSVTREVLEGSSAAADFFSSRRTDVEAVCSDEVNHVDVFDYITALILASFFYCRCPQTDAVINAKKLYSFNLQAIIRVRFPFAPDDLPITHDMEQDALAVGLLMQELADKISFYGSLLFKEHGVDLLRKIDLYKNEYSNVDQNSRTSTPTLTR